MSYWSEIQKLPKVWSWAAHEADVRRLKCTLDRLAEGPLVVVGSGGSSAACALAARLHQQMTGWMAVAVTPLEDLRAPPARGGVLLISASGKNPDILAAAKHALAATEGPVAALCLRGASPLAELLAPTHNESLAGLEYPLAKDGFLATGTLLATLALLARGWGMAAPPDPLPALTAEALDAQALDTQGLAGARSLVALASGWASMAAIDLESRWGEAGLGSVTALDPRNFAHGRHQGLSRLASDTAVVALTTPADEEVIGGTLDLLPTAISTHRVQTPLDGPWGAIDLVVRTLTLAGTIGLFSYLKSKKVVIALHDPVPHSGEYNWREDVPNFVFYRLAQSFIFYSKFAVAQFREHYAQFKVPLHDIKLQPYTFIKQYIGNQKNDGDYILFFGRLSYYKGIDILLEAIPKVLERFPHQKFKIAGKPVFGYEVDQAVVNKYPHNIEVDSRYLSTEELVGCIGGSKFIVCPYRDATQSGVLMTAFAAGKTVLASNVGSFPEYIKDGYNGLLCEPNADSLAANIIAALEGSTYLSFQEKVIDHYSEEVGEYNSNAILQAYQHT